MVFTWVGKYFSGIVDQKGPKMWCLLVLFILSSCSCYVIDSDDPAGGVIWPTEYHLKGEETDLVVGIVQPFEIWYSAESNKSRIDYYGGLDKIFYYGESEQDVARIYKVFPMTTKNLTNTVYCLSDTDVEEIKDFLPDVDDMSYDGEIVYDRNVQVWVSSKIDDDGDTVETTLYVYRDDSGVDVPVRLEKKIYKMWTEALDTHIITTYSDFKLPNSSYFNVTNIDECEDANIGNDLKKALNFYHPDVPADLNRAFDIYKYHHKKEYMEKEHEKRKAIFQRNWK